MTVTARVHIAGQLLLPTCESVSAERALEYVDTALSEYRPPDRLSVRTQGQVATAWNLSAASQLEALAWLRERLAPAAGGAEDEGSRSGTREASPDPAEGEAPAKREAG